MKRIKHDPKSEAAQREGYRLWKQFKAEIIASPGFDARMTPMFEVVTGGRVFATFDLRDCYRKRSSIKMKSLRAAIQPRKIKRK